MKDLHGTGPTEYGEVQEFIKTLKPGQSYSSDMQMVFDTWEEYNTYQGQQSKSEMVKSQGQMSQETADFYRLAASRAGIECQILEPGEVLPNSSQRVSRGKVGFALIGCGSEELARFHAESEKLGRETRKS